MKQTTKMSRAVSQLEHIYNSLNTDFWSGELPVPIITVQSKPGTYGHCTTAKVWRRSDDATYELNISAETLNYPLEDLIDTMLHEMVHLYCREHDIQEVSRGGKYHNGTFKRIAETHGLICYKEGQYGWNTKPGDNLVEYALSNGWNEIRIGRNTLTLSLGAPLAGGQPTQPEGKRPSSTRKYICPQCGNSCRATKELNLICGDCMVPLKLA